MAVGAISGAEYQIDPDSNVFTSHATLTGTNYQIDGGVEPIIGGLEGATYSVESGSSFSYYCGDGFVDPTEDCDGDDLASQACSTQGFSSGVLACNAPSCSFDTSACVAMAGGGGGGGSVNLPSPHLDEEIADITYTYKPSFLLYGSKGISIDKITVNGKEKGVKFPTSKSWQSLVSLSYGFNSFAVVNFDGVVQSSSTVFEIYRRLAGDMTQDNTVNDYDLSLFIKEWGEENSPADFNENGMVDDYDFSMMVARWNLSI